MWNQVQSLSGSVQDLIILVQQVLAAGRFIRSDNDDRVLLPFVTTTTTVAAPQQMTALESECITAMNQAYDAIYPCCKPSKDCNETFINSTAYFVGSFQAQLESVGNITEVFNDTYWIIAAKIGELDENCESMSMATAASTTPSTTVAAPTVAEETTSTTAVSTTSTTAYACCPEYEDKHDCEALCALVNQLGTLEEQIAAILAALNGKKLRMRQARSAVDHDMEDSLLDSLKEAFVVTENCVDFDICNGIYLYFSSAFD